MVDGLHEAARSSEEAGRKGAEARCRSADRTINKDESDKDEVAKVSTVTAEDVEALCSKYRHFLGGLRGNVTLEMSNNQSLSIFVILGEETEGNTTLSPATLSKRRTGIG